MATDRITVDDVAHLVRKQLGAKLPDDVELAAETELEDLGISSLDQAEVFFEVEEMVQLELDATAAADVTTLGEFVAALNALIAQQHPQQEPSTAS